MASIYHKRDNQPSILWYIYIYIYRIPETIRTLEALFRPPWAPRANNQATVHLGPNRFHMALASLKSAQYSPRYVPEKFGPNGWPIFYRLLKVDPMSFRNKLTVNPVETFSCKIDDYMKYYIFWRYSRLTRVQIYGPCGPIFYTLLRVIPVRFTSTRIQLKPLKERI